MSSKEKIISMLRYSCDKKALISMCWWALYIHVYFWSNVCWRRKRAALKLIQCLPRWLLFLKDSVNSYFPSCTLRSLSCKGCKNSPLDLRLKILTVSIRPTCWCTFIWLFSGDGFYLQKCWKACWDMLCLDMARKVTELSFFLVSQREPVRPKWIGCSCFTIYGMHANDFWKIRCWTRRTNVHFIFFTLHYNSKHNFVLSFGSIYRYILFTIFGCKCVFLVFWFVVIYNMRKLA